MPISSLKQSCFRRKNKSSPTNALGHRTWREGRFELENEEEIWNANPR